MRPAGNWVCIVNPGEASWNTLRDLLSEAHDFAARKHANQQTRRSSLSDS